MSTCSVDDRLIDGSPPPGIARSRGGLYVIQHRDRCLYTLGKYDKSLLADRLKKHAKEYVAPFKVHRHQFHPFTEVVFSVDLRAWSSIAIDLAEAALYLAVGVEHRFVGKSIFEAPRNANFATARARLLSDLAAIERVYADEEQR